MGSAALICPRLAEAFHLSELSEEGNIGLLWLVSLGMQPLVTRAPGAPVHGINKVEGDSSPGASISSPLKSKTAQACSLCCGMSWGTRRCCEMLRRSGRIPEGVCELAHAIRFLQDTQSFEERLRICQFGMLKDQMAVTMRRAVGMLLLPGANLWAFNSTCGLTSSRPWKASSVEK